MADEKKPDKKAEKPAPAPFFWTHPDPFVELVLTVICFVVILFFINNFIGLIDSSSLSPYLWLQKIWDFLDGNSFITWVFRSIGILVTILCAFLMFDTIRKLTVLRKNQRELLYPAMAPIATATNPLWEKITAQVESFNESDWRQAVMSADIMLDGILNKLHLPGDTMGDKLKAVERSDFTTLSNAWDAHKVRNMIAHEPTFVLTQREAKRVVSLYQTVFDEFKII